MRKSPRQPQHHNVHKVVLIILILAIGILAFVGSKHFFIIRSIHCEVEHQPCPSALVTELQTWTGHSVFFFQYTQALQHLLTRYPTLSNPHLQKKLPDQVWVDFQQRLPAYQLRQSGQIFNIDEDGHVIQIAASTSALLNFDVSDNALSPLTISSQLDPAIASQLDTLVVFVHTHDIPYTRFVIDSAKEIHVELNDGKRALFRIDQLETELPKLTAVLQSVDFAKYPAPITIIDLRFKYPVLKTQ